MPKNSPLPVPKKGQLFQWVMANEDGIIALVQWYNKMQALEMGIVSPGGYNTAKHALVDGGDNILLPIPIQAPNAWEAPTGTASRATFVTSSVTTAQLAQRVMALELDFMATKILPTSV